MGQEHDDPNNEREDPQSASWTSEDQDQLMSRYEQIAEEAQGAPSKDGKSVVADYGLGGAVPRSEQSRARYKAKDIYVRLENTIYGPITQDELSAMLQSGELTGFESASADLQHWTPLIYHPRMTLSGEIDPDATHDLLHQHSTLPAASRPVDKFDLEALADEEEEPPPPSTPLAAILIKPMKVSRKTGLPLPVHADLDEEPLEKVIERTDISPEQREAGTEALAEIAQQAQDLAERGELSLSGEHVAVAEGDSAPFPVASAAPSAPMPSDESGDFDLEVDVDSGAMVAFEDTAAEDPVPASGSDEVAAAIAAAESESNTSVFVTWLVVLLLLASAGVAAMTMLRASTPEEVPAPVVDEAPAEEAPAPTAP